MICSVCRHEGTLKTMASGKLVCTVCIASLLADGYRIPGVDKCSICSEIIIQDGKVERAVCDRCRKKWNGLV